MLYRYGLYSVNWYLCLLVAIYEYEFKLDYCMLDVPLNPHSGARAQWTFHVAVQILGFS